MAVPALRSMEKESMEQIKNDLASLATRNAIGATLKFEVSPSSPSPIARAITNDTKEVVFKPEISKVPKTDLLNRVAENLGNVVPNSVQRVTITFNYATDMPSSAVGRFLGSKLGEMIFDRDTDGNFKPTGTAVPTKR